MTKATFEAEVIAVKSDGWEKDWTVILRVPAKDWEKMAYLKTIKKTITTIKSGE